MVPRDSRGSVGVGMALSLAAVAAVVKLFVGAVTTEAKVVRFHPYADTSARPECPHDPLLPFIDSSLRKPALRLTSQVPLSGPITDIPEFHDCQRFIIDSMGEDVYGSLYAIYASLNLASLALRIDSLRDTTIHPEYIGKVAAVPAATVFSYGGTSLDPGYRDKGVYNQLHIGPYWNCLYMWRQGERWRAWMIGEEYSDRCRDPLVIDPLRSGRTELMVTVHPSGSQGMVPPVARWDWDEARRQQYIGIACGEAWCDVSQALYPKQGLVPPPVILSWDPIPGLMAARPFEVDRVTKVKGWYDAQRLALMGANGRPYPSKIWGVVIPHPTLGRQTGTLLQTLGADSMWVHVATALVTENYSGKVLRLLAGQENKIYLCDGTAGACGTTKVCGPPPSGATRLWTKVTHKDAVGKIVAVYLCETKRIPANNPPPTVPGTARWRWLRDDETTWKRCDPGCCETNPR